MRRAVAPPAPRVHVVAELAPGATISLPAAAAHHLARVLRVSRGDPLVVFNNGAEFDATIAHIDKQRVSVKLAAGHAVDRETPLACALAQAISSGDRMDLTLQKAVELGIARIQPLFSTRSVVKLDAERSERRLVHWRQVVTSACEQCGRNVIPEVAPPLPYTDWLGQLAPAGPGEARILLSPHAQARLADLPQPQTVTLLAGPEGGYSEIEVELASRYGFTEVKLGPRILRTETAALAALAAINTLWGDF